MLSNLPHSPTLCDQSRPNIITSSRQVKQNELKCSAPKMVCLHSQLLSPSPFPLFPFTPPFLFKNVVFFPICFPSFCFPFFPLSISLPFIFQPITVIILLCESGYWDFKEHFHVNKQQPLPHHKKKKSTRINDSYTNLACTYHPLSDLCYGNQNYLSNWSSQCTCHENLRLKIHDFQNFRVCVYFAQVRDLFLERCRSLS